MSDFAQVILVGNLQQDVRMHTDPEDGTVYGTSVLCVGQTRINQGQPQTITLTLPIEIRGSSRVARFRQAFGRGSRILCQGHLAQRPGGQAGMLSIVVDMVFNAVFPPDVIPRQVEETAHTPAHEGWRAVWHE